VRPVDDGPVLPEPELEAAIDEDERDAHGRLVGEDEHAQAAHHQPLVDLHELDPVELRAVLGRERRERAVEARELRRRRRLSLPVGPEPRDERAGHARDVDRERERHVHARGVVRARLAGHAVVDREHAPLSTRRDLVGPVAPEVVEDEPATRVGDGGPSFPPVGSSRRPSRPRDAGTNTQRDTWPRRKRTT